MFIIKTKLDGDHLNDLMTEPLKKIIELERDELQLQLEMKTNALREAEMRERKLLESLNDVVTREKRYRTLYEEAPDLYRTINMDGIILDCNKSYADTLGYSKDEIIGKKIFDHVAEYSITALHDSFVKWKTEGRVINEEIWFKRKDGTIFPTLLSATTIYDQNGKCAGSNTAIIDMTEIYEARQTIEENQMQLRAQLEKLKALDIAKNEFLTMITHELRTPLVPIIAYVDILLSQKIGMLNKIQQNRLVIIKSSLNSLIKIISDLLDAQKIELGQLTLIKDTHNIADIINNVILKLEPDLDSHGIMITKNTQNLSCMCDKTRIEQVLNNLITNAMGFCPKGKGKIDIQLDTENDVYARIIVKDNGVGMQKSDLDKIFVKFYQVDTTTTREHGGIGLSLSVCKGIIEGHGGKIWVESEGTGKGAEIHILLPLPNKSISFENDKRNTQTRLKNSK